jgi:arylformamidase
MRKEGIVISSDHAGFELKEDIKSFLVELGYEVEDVGTFSGATSVDYADYTLQAAQKVSVGKYSRAILFCGTGIGTCIAANKVPGIRAALCHDTFTAGLSRAHNNTNALVLAGWLTGKRLAREIVTIWLNTPFSEGRHVQRLEKVKAIETHARLGRGKVYDVSHTIHSGMLVWPTDPTVTIEPVKSLANGGSSNVSRLSISSHSGTHIDAPHHYIEGAAGVDAIPAGILMGQARVFHFDALLTRIDRQVLAGLDIHGQTRILLKTRNSALWQTGKFTKDYAYLTEDGARYLVEEGVKLVGTDYLSIEEFDNKKRSAHHTLLEGGVVIVEGLDLSDVPEGDYELLCLPLKIKDGDGAPVRAFLREL